MRRWRAVAMPTALRPMAKRVQFFHSAPTFTYEIKSSATEPPRELLGAKDLVGELDKPTVPRLRPNA
jgi:hypothetical protein